MKKPPRKNKPGAGRKAEGRVRGHLYMRPEAWDAIAAEVRGKGDTLGKAIERKYGVAGGREIVN